MTASTVPAAQAALLALLTTAFEASADTHVQFGFPLKVPKKLERVYLMEDETRYRRGGGEQYRTETYGLQVAVEVYRQGSDSQAAVARRWEMISAIDDALTEADFYGYLTEGAEMTSDPVTVAWDKGFLAKAILGIPVLALQ